MATPKELYYEKRGHLLVKNLKSRHFDAYYCANREEALKTALELIPEGASVGWGGAMSAQQIGLLDAVRSGNFRALDRETCTTAEERDAIAREGIALKLLPGAEILCLPETPQMARNRVLPTIGNTDYLNCVWYLKRVNIENNGLDVILHFGAVDCFATYYLNGEKIGESDNMFIANDFDVTEKINLSLEEIFMQEMKGEDYDYKSILN